MATEYEVVFRVEAESPTDVRDLADQLRHAVTLASRRVTPGLYGRVRINGWFAQSKDECHICHRRRDEPGAIYCSAVHKGGSVE